MRRVFLIGCFLFLCGCGNTVKDPDDNTEALLQGMWDSVSNDANVCHERLRINSDRTFWWFEETVTNVGTYGREGDKLNFMFTNKAWELVQFSVTDRQLFLVRVGKKKVYTRIPITVAKNSSPCPTEK